MSGNVVLETLRHAWQTLEPIHAPMAVMGGLALAAWQHVRATQDVDLLVGTEHEKISEVLRPMVSAGFRAKNSPPTKTLGDIQLIQFLYQPSAILVDIQVALIIVESAYHRTALSRCLATRLPGLDTEIRVLACEDLILHKLLAGRIVDRADVVALLLANRAALDTAYLIQWSGRLGLNEDLAEAWDTAFHGERLL